MAEGNKSEKATPKKRRDERKKGNVFLSKDAIAVVSLFLVFLTLRITAGGMAEQIFHFFRLCMTYAAQLSVGQLSGHFSPLFLEGILVLAKTAGPLMAVAAFAAIAGTFFQTKMLVSGEAIKPKFNRISPIQGFKKLFSLRSVIEALKGIFKITILLYIIFNYLINTIPIFFNYPAMDLVAACRHLFGHAFAMVMQIALAFAALAAFDFFFQWWDYERKLKMTKQEVKDEYKQIEGDPQIKSKIKETQRKMAQSRMMQQVPSADVVIRNPNHVAVALRYRPEIDNAPIVLAMGLDELALRIVKVAQENKVTVVENVPLARSLYASSELGREIHPDLYTAVADVLVYLYKIGSGSSPLA